MKYLKYLFYIFVTFIILSYSISCDAAEYFVRADGGDNTECDGSANVAWDTVDDDVVAACAFNHPNWVHAINNNPTLMTGGDIMTIHCGDSFKMGYGTPNTSDTTQCPATGSGNNTRNCYTPQVPSGVDTNNHTIIRGDCYDTGCSNPPELYSTEQLSRIFNFGNYTTFECLELTDRSTCVKGVSGHTNQCDQTYPAGDWGDKGLFNWGDSTDIVMKNLYIHGFGLYGIHAGGFNGLEVDSVYLDGNSWGGWQFDLGGGLPSNSGTLNFKNVHVRYNGYVETYPQVATTKAVDDISQDYINATAQDIGGYGDGFGTPATYGDWTFEDSSFIANSSDGLDLLYVREGGSAIVRRSKFYNNNGNQLKLSGSALIEDNFFGGTCGYVQESGKKHGSINGYYFQVCRAGGDTVALAIKSPGVQYDIYNNTFLGNGNYNLIVDNNWGITCDGSEYIKLRNNVFLSGEQWTNSAAETNLYTGTSLGSCYSYFNSPDWGTDNSNIAYNTNNDKGCATYSDGFTCPQADPDFVGVTITGLGADFVCTDTDVCDVTLNAGSPAIGIGNSVLPNDSLDLTGGDRGAVYDAGAYEYSTVAASCSTDCSLCGDQTSCEASSATDCNGTGFCCWNTSVCETTAAPSCDIDNCSLCGTQSPCETAGCTWNGSSCQTPQAPGTGSTFTGGCNMKGFTIK